MTARDDYPMATNDWSIDVINRALDEIDRLRAIEEDAIYRLDKILGLKVDPSGCCGDASWRGRLCQYHSGFRDALDRITN